jgi:mannose-1-phosphate guanylyltransferase
LDENKNAIKGSNVFIYDSQDNIVNVPEEKLVVMQGIQGYIVAEKDGNLLICKKENEQQIKQFISDIKNVNN